MSATSDDSIGTPAAPPGDPLTEEDGYRALHGHLVDKARLARERYGPRVDADGVRRMLVDAEIVRYPTQIVFDEAVLLPGEFAWARPSEAGPKGGFTLFVHPHFEARPDVLPLLVAYHVPSINYLDVATNEEAELFGATLLGLDVDDYYARLCTLMDSVPGAPSPEVPPMVAGLLAPDSTPSSGGACGSGSCGCGGGVPGGGPSL